MTINKNKIIKNFGNYYPGEKLDYQLMDNATGESNNCAILAISHLLDQDYNLIKKRFSEYEHKYLSEVTELEILSIEFGFKYLILENDFNKIPNDSIVNIVDASNSKHVCFWSDDKNSDKMYPSNHCFLKKNGKRWDVKNTPCYILGYHSQNAKKGAAHFDFSSKKFEKSVAEFSKIYLDFAVKTGFKVFDSNSTLCIQTTNGIEIKNNGR